MTSGQQAPAASEGVAGAPTGRILTALIVGGITPILDTTIVSVGLKTITRELDTSVSTIQWVTTGYLLALAVAIPFVSWAQSRFGGKRLWIAALSIFILGSILCACAWNVDSLIVFRVIQGFGGGVLFPLMSTLAMQSVTPAQMAKTSATIGVPIALGPILGPVLGGIVLNSLDWRWLFLINVPIGIVGLVLAFVLLPSDRPPVGAPRIRLDFVGALLLAPALVGLLYGLSQADTAAGFGAPRVWIAAVAGALLLVGFVAWAIPRHERAIIDVGLFKVRSVRSASIALTFMGGTMFAGTFLMPLYFQTLRGDTVLQAGLLMIPQGVGSLLARFVTGRLVTRFGSRLVAVVSFAVVVVATLPFAWVSGTTSIWLIGTALFVRGLGLGAVLIPMMAVAYVDIPRSSMPSASAITRIVQQVGGAFGTALVAVVVTNGLAGAQATSDAAGAFDRAFWLAIAIAAAAGIASLMLPPRTAAPALDR